MSKAKDNGEEAQRLIKEVELLQSKIEAKEKLKQQIEETFNIKNEEHVKLKVKARAIKKELEGIKGQDGGAKEEEKDAGKKDDGKSEVGGKSQKS